MLDILINITTTIISGCFVAMFTHWLRNRNKKDDKTTPLKSLTTDDSKGIRCLTYMLDIL